MKSNSHLLQTFFYSLILGSCSTFLCVGCEESEDATYTTPPNASTTDGKKPNQGFAPPVITVDLTKFATDFGASFQVQADSLEMMASGKTLNAQQSTAYFEAQNNSAKIAVQLSDLLQKNPRWQKATTEALEANAKKGIIALYHAEKALKKAKDSRSAGSTTGKCPAEISKYVNDQYLIVTRIRGLMPYSKDEMATPSSKNIPANSDSK